MHLSLNDRTDHALFIGYDHALTPDLWIAPYYRFQYFRYTRTGKRHEYLQTLGLSFLWRITPAVQVQFLVNHDWRESGDPVQPDYRKLDAGLGINLQARF